VDILVIDVLEINLEFLRRGSEITLLEDVEIVVLVDKDPNTNIELSVKDEQGSFNILLNDERVVLDLKGRGLLLRFLWTAFLGYNFRLLFLCPDFLVLALAVLFDELVQRFKVSENMDPAPPVQVSGLQKPQVEPVEVAKGETILRCGALLEVEGLELCYL